MESRPKRSTRNQEPSYTFQTEEDFFKKNLIEKRKSDILALLKRDLKRPRTAADVGSKKHLDKLGREARVIPSQLRKWLGITDDLTQVNTSSLSSTEKNLVRKASRKEVLNKLGKELESVERKFEDFLESDRDFQRDNESSEAQLNDLEEKIHGASEMSVKPKEEPMLMPATETSSVQEESPVMVKSIHLDEDEDNEDADDEDDLSVSIVLTERHSSILDKWRSQMGKMQAEMRERIRNKMEAKSDSGEQFVKSADNSDYETADDSDETMEDYLQQQKDFEGSGANMELETSDENEKRGHE